VARAVLIGRVDLRPALAALCTLVPGCLMPDSGNAHFRCDLDGNCPPGESCSAAGVCEGATVTSVPPDMIEFPTASFMMGCSGDGPGCTGDAQPMHEVTLSGFALDPSEVSQAAYSECAARNVNCQAPMADFTPTANPELPVRGLTWDDADAYCRYRNKRLPTEAEWERAAKNAANPYPWTTTDLDCSHAQYAMCQPSGPVLPTMLPAGDTPDGLHHMAGNVREWVQDCYLSDFYKQSQAQSPSPVTNPFPSNCPRDSGDYVLRGGAFDSEPDALAVWHREFFDPRQGPPDAGVRCAITLP